MRAAAGAAVGARAAWAGAGAVDGREVVEVTGSVAELLPRALCRVAVDGHRDVVAHAGGGTRRNFVRLSSATGWSCSSRPTTWGAAGSSAGCGGQGTR